MRRTILVTILTAVCLVSLAVGLNSVPGHASASREGTRSVVGMSFARKYGDSLVEVRVHGGDWRVSKADLVAWVDDAALSLISYYGRFPIDRTVIDVRQTNGRGVGFASATYSDEREIGLIEANLGKYTRPDDLRDTWTLTHEMIHLAAPHFYRQYKWLSEGLATYVEPIGRMRRGLIPRERIWRELVENLPSGQPRYGDQGLDGTPTWGRVYWGGALYCLYADVEIRRRTNNRSGLEEALRAILSRGVTSESEVMSAPRFLQMGDRSVGVTVLMDLYDQMKDRPMRVDLNHLWSQLGVKQTADGSIRFDDSAPLAHVRRAIEKGRS